MNELRNWLAPTIRDELSQAIQWKETGLHHEQQRISTSENITDDGSNFRIQVATEGVVQIHKFLTFAEPIRATLADQSTRINATISRSAIRNYENHMRKHFTKETTGGLIQVLQFEIVATDIGPRSDRLTLFVKEFKSLGSDGSAVNDIPRPIESPDKCCFNLNEKLMAIRKYEESTGNKVSSTRDSSAAPSSTQSQVASTYSNEELLDSQSGFLTQIPVARKVHAKSQQNANSFLFINTRQKEVETSDVDEADIKQRAKDASDNASHIPYDREASRSGSSADLLLENQSQNISKSIKGAPSLAAEGPEEAVPVSNKALKNAYGNYSTTKIPDTHRSTEDFPTGMHITTSIAPPSPSQALSQRMDRPVKKGKLNERISSRDVRIPRDQEALLSRQDSWLPPEPGQQEPHANIPIALLQTFNEEADRQKDNKSIQEGLEANAASGREEDSNSTQASESDSDIPSEEWPSSPKRDQLPPDSSPPDVELSNPRFNGVGSLQSSRENTVSEEVIPADVPTSSKDHDNIQPTENDALRHASGSESRPISLLSSNLARSSQNTSKETLQGQREEAMPDDQEAQPAIDEEHRGKQLQSEDPAESQAPNPDIFHSSTSLPDSDIEMTVPKPLQPSVKLPMSPLFHENVPSTAPLLMQPFTQVKRTPYTNGHGHPNPHTRHTSTWRAKFDEANDSVNNVLKEGNTQISCTTSTLFSNSEDHKTSSCVNRKSLMVPDQASPQGISITEEHTSNGFSLAANERSIEVCDHASARENLPAKRPLQGEGKPLDGSSSSKRQKTNTHFNSPRPREASIKSPGLDSPLNAEIPTNPTAPEPGSSQKVSSSKNSDAIDSANISPESFANDNVVETANVDNIKNTDCNDGDVKTTNNTKSDSASLPILENPSPNQNNNHSDESLAQLATHNRDQNHNDYEVIHANQVPDVIALSRSIVYLPEPRSCSPVSKVVEAAKNKLSRHSSSFTMDTARVTATDALPAINGHDRHRATPTLKGRDGLSFQKFEISHNIVQGLFSVFKSAYPEYTGDMKHFLSLCQKIWRLGKHDHLHPSLWDDFLLRSKAEYADHIQGCLENGEDPLPYEKFYNDEIDEPRYRKKVLTRAKLDDIFRGERTSTVPSHTTGDDLNAVSPTAGNEKVNDLRKETNFIGTIDLTQDDIEIETIGEQERKDSSEAQPFLRRRLPWLTDRHSANTPKSEDPHAPRTKQRHTPLPESSKLQSEKVHSPSKRLKMDPQSTRSGKMKFESTNAQVLAPESHESLPALWWQDENTPFKKFMRSYLSIRPGNGNTFAKPEDIAQGQKEHPKRLVRSLKDLDLEKWKV